MLDAATQWVTQATPLAFWFTFLVATGLAVAAFVYAFIFLQRVRVIEDTPTAKIRSAAQGYGELSGMAQLMDGAPIVAPLTGKTCAWFRYKVEKMGDKHTHVVDSGSSDELFLLVGRTGRCVIDPEGATVITRHKEVWFDYSYPSRKRGGRSGLLGQMLGRVGSRYRYTEERLRAGEPLYAIGMFKSVGGGAESFNTEEEVRVLLRPMATATSTCRNGRRCARRPISRYARNSHSAAWRRQRMSCRSRFTASGPICCLRCPKRNW